MGTRSRSKGTKKTAQPRPQEDKPAQQAPEQSPSADSAADAAKEAPATMRKGVYLSALIYVEGDQAPADDFTAAAKSAVSDALAKCAPSGYTITLKKAQAQNDVEEDDAGEGGDDKGAKSKKDSFEF